MKSKKKPRILIVDDQDHYAELCHRFLPNYEYLSRSRRKSKPVRASLNASSHAHSWKEVQEIMKAHGNRVDLLLLDLYFDLPEKDLLIPDSISTEKLRSKPALLESVQARQGLEILKAFRKKYGSVPAILMTSREELPSEIEEEAWLADGYTFFLNDEYVDIRTLDGEMRRVLTLRQSPAGEDGGILWGSSLKMQEIRQTLEALAGGDFPILIEGETGSGKSLIAREYIYPVSGRQGPLVTVDISILPSDLVPAHLFGVVKGAYTGAVADRPGVFEQANGGMLFIDEIGNIDLSVQKQLLLVLERGIVTPLGSVREIKVDVTLVACTSENLEQKVEAGEFRRDLYMRLCPSSIIRLSSLRQRLEDLPFFLRGFIAKSAMKKKVATLLDEYCSRRSIPFDPECPFVQVALEKLPKTIQEPVFFIDCRTYRLLKRHSWPGNLRELEMVAQNAVLFTLMNLRDEPEGDRTDPRRSIIPITYRTVRNLIPASNKKSGGISHTAELTVTIKPSESLNAISREVEKQYLTHLYRQCSGDFSLMAKILLGNDKSGRKVLLRFNQLGLRVKELRK